MRISVKMYVQAVFIALLMNGVQIRYGPLIQGARGEPLLRDFLIGCMLIEFLGGFIVVVMLPYFIEYLIWLVRGDRRVR